MIIKNILIVRTDRIGDVVLSLPLAKMIKNKYPDCRISFLIREYTYPIVKKNKYVDEILLLKEKTGIPFIKENIELLKSKRFDVSLVVYPTFRLSWILFNSNIPIRIGTGYRWYSFLFSKKIYEHRKDAKKHELEYNLNMLKSLDIAYPSNLDLLDFSLCADETAKKRIEQKLSAMGLQNDREIIIVHPGSGGSSVDLPISKYTELVRMLSALDCTIIITGSEKENEICSRLILSSNIINFAGKINLDDLIALIDKSIIFISNSTGPIHIAAALKKHVIGFYPKIVACSQTRWGPYTKDKIIFTPTIDCQNCSREQCEKLNCMSSIDMKDVFVKIEKIYKLLSNNGEI